MLNGVASGKWEIGNLIFGFANAAVYSIVFLFVYYSLGEESSDSLTSYFAYLSTLISFIIIAELVALFITSDQIFIDGSINKVAVALGWGIWNLVGVSAVVLIPMNFYGMAKNKCPWLYFATATLIWLISVLSMSRNALIFGTLTYAACVLIFSFVGERKKIFRIIVLIGIACAAIFAVVFFDKIYALFKDFFDRGLSDNGRYALWRAAFKNFLDAPIFGKGFYGFNTAVDTFGALPESAHNTVLQLLSAGGILAFLAYAFYRYKTLIPFIKKPCLLKTLLGISVLALVLGSLLDNFIFDIYPTFYMSAALAIAFRKFDEENESSAMGDIDKA
jgi:O-antigen ligase